MEEGFFKAEKILHKSVLYLKMIIWEKAYESWWFLPTIVCQIPEDIISVKTPCRGNSSSLHTNEEHKMQKRKACTGWASLISKTEIWNMKYSEIRIFWALVVKQNKTKQMWMLWKHSIKHSWFVNPEKLLVQVFVHVLGSQFFISQMTKPHISVRYHWCTCSQATESLPVITCS